MNKTLLALAISATVTLTACGDDASLSGDPTVDATITDSLNAETQIAFDLLSDPSNPVLITPSYLVVDAVDGTLKSDGEVNSAAYATDLSDPAVALGKTDGWSLNQPITIAFTGVDLDPATAEDGFFLLETGDPQADDYANTTPIPLTAANGDFRVTVSETTLTIVPLKPFNAASHYQFAVTSALKDNKGNPVGMSPSYAVLKSTNPTPNVALAPAQQLAQRSEATFAATGVDKDSIIFTNWFTTASVGSVLSTTKAVIAHTFDVVRQGGTANQIWKGSANPNNVDLSTLYHITLSPVEDIATFFNNNAQLNRLVGQDQTTLNGLTAAYTALGATLYTGTIDLPYFLQTDTADNAWQTTPWQSATPSLAKIRHVMTNGTDADKAAVQTSLNGIDIAKLLTGDTTEFIKLIGSSVTLADGSPLDNERVMTQFSPVPQIQSIQRVPLLLIVPNQPSSGVVVYQHGLAYTKETAYLFGANHLSSTLGKGNAIIAIDHPLHGARALADGTVTTESHADVYMNLAYLNVARDNLRQSMIDTLGVRASLALMQVANAPVFTELDLNKTGIFGHSLGAITGLGAYHLGTTSLGQPTADALFNFNAGAFANPGGGIASLLLESETFGPTIKHTLLLGADNAAYQAICGSAPDGGACYSAFFASVDAASQAAINHTVGTFTYGAQTVLDTVDPYNFARDINGPVYVMQAENDPIIPNQTTQFSLMGGTEPLVAELGLSPLTQTLSGEAVKHVARFDAITSQVQHSSVIAPAQVDKQGNVIDPAVALATSAEAQLQVASYLAAQGQGIAVGDATLLKANHE
ncbi:lipase [Photobacterium japonica]|uniref:VolA/Pla-1 family phospholipase n=1 Tax=Photobacterium japonica TaxID=2910235 RepID=UPI003D114E3C